MIFHFLSIITLNKSHMYNYFLIRYNLIYFCRIIITNLKCLICTVKHNLKTIIIIIKH